MKQAAPWPGTKPHGGFASTGSDSRRIDACRAARRIAPPADAPRMWRAHLESHGAQFSPERPGANPVGLDSMVFDARFLETTSQFFIDRLTARGPTVEVAVGDRAGRRGLVAQARHRRRPQRHIRSHPPVAAIHQSGRARMVRRKPPRRAAARIDESRLDRRRHRRDGAQARPAAREPCTASSPPTTSASTSCPACRR